MREIAEKNFGVIAYDVSGDYSLKCIKKEMWRM